MENSRRQTDRELRWVVRLVLVLFVAVLAMTAVSQVVTLRVARTAERNSNRIGHNERTDIMASRLALYRLCARDNRERAGHHWAYQQAVKGGLHLPPVVLTQLRSEPALAYFLARSAIQSRENLRRTQRNLPILDCTPNLVGGGAKPLPRRTQERFVSAWAAGKIDPIPDPTKALDMR